MGPDFDPEDVRRLQEVNASDVARLNEGMDRAVAASRDTSRAMFDVAAAARQIANEDLASEEHALAREAATIQQRADELADRIEMMRIAARGVFRG